MQQEVEQGEKELVSSPVTLYQTPEPSPLEQLAQAVREETITADNPYVVFGDKARSLAKVLGWNVAARLKARGFLLTFQRNKLDLPSDAAVEFIPQETILDRAGVQYSSPNKNDIFGEIPLPLSPETIIDAVKVRASDVLKFGEPLEPNYQTFQELAKNQDLGFGLKRGGLIQPDAMMLATYKNGAWSPVEAFPYSALQFSPNAQILHYGGGLFEGMSAELGVDGNCYIYGIQEHYERMARGAKNLGLTPPTFEIFEKAMIEAVQQNARFIPANGRLYIRPHLLDPDPQMKVGATGTTAFLVEVTPIGGVDAYFGKTEGANENNENIPPRVMAMPVNDVRAADGKGSTKAVGNYAPTVPVIRAVSNLNLGKEGEKALRPDGVLYGNQIVVDKEGTVDEEKLRTMRVCESHASNSVFIEQISDGRYKLVAPTLEHGDILPSNTRKLLLEKAHELGMEIEERDVTMSDILDKRFCAAINCGTAAVLTHFDAIQLVLIKEGDKELIAEPVGELLEIRDQQARNKEPKPKIVKDLLQAILAVKSGNCSDKEKEQYLTKVPGLKRRQ